MHAYGVYINRDIEIVITEKYLAAYRRAKSQNALEACLLEREDQTERYVYRGICRSLPATALANPKPQKWQFAFKSAKKKFYNNRRFAEWLENAVPLFQPVENGLLVSFPDGDTYSARKVETFGMSDLHPLPPAIHAGNIEECLKSWHMGVQAETIPIGGNDACTGVTINTNDHMYIFQMLPKNFYCRAARYRTCRSGVVFNQNFRQRTGDFSETYMVEDNTIASAPLPLDDQFFGVCQIINYGQLMQQHLTERERDILCYRFGLNGFERKTQAELSRSLGISRSSVSRIQKKAVKTIESVIPKPTDQNNNIYWTVDSYSDQQIILNGCQGDRYEWNKPSHDLNERVE